MSGKHEERGKELSSCWYNATIRHLHCLAVPFMLSHPLSGFEIQILLVMLFVLVGPQAISGPEMQNLIVVRSINVQSQSISRPGCFPTNVTGVVDVSEMDCLYVSSNIKIFTFFSTNLANEHLLL